MAISTRTRVAPNVHQIPTEHLSYDFPAYVQLPPRRAPGQRLLYMVGITCVAATIFLLVRGHQCLRVLDSHEKLAGGIKERFLSVAERGTFRKCVESGSLLKHERSRPGSGVISSRASGGSSTASSGGAPSGTSSGSSMGGSNGAAYGNLHAPAIAETEAQKISPSLQKIKVPASSKGALVASLLNKHTILGSFMGSPAGFAPGCTSLESCGEDSGDASSVDTAQEEDAHTSEKSNPSAKSVLLDIPLDRAEHARQLRLLQPPGGACLDLTDLELEMLHTAENHLRIMLKKRSNLLRSLHENWARQRLLFSRDQQLASQVSPSSLEDRRRVQGRLSKLEAEARLLESKVCRVRQELKHLIPRKQHLALSLRLVAGRRASGAFIAPSAAAALSAAIIIVEGNDSKHFLATSTEEAEILKMSAELLTRMQKSTETLVKRLEASEPGSGGGLAVLRDFWALERQYKRCRSLQKGASTFIRQLRFVLMSVSPRRRIEELEKADKDLRKAMERCTYILQNRRHSNGSGLLGSLFKRLRVKSGRAGGTKALTNEAVDNTSLG